VRRSPDEVQSISRQLSLPQCHFPGHVPPRAMTFARFCRSVWPRTWSRSGSVRLALEQVQNQEPAYNLNQWTRLDALCSYRQPRDQCLCAVRFYIHSTGTASVSKIRKKYYLHMLVLVRVSRKPRKTQLRELRKAPCNCVLIPWRAYGKKKLLLQNSG
jgi:hypothetical protein